FPFSTIYLSLFLLRPPPTPTLFPYTTLFRSHRAFVEAAARAVTGVEHRAGHIGAAPQAALHLAQPAGFGVLARRDADEPQKPAGDRKSTRLNSSHRTISYAVFCLKKKKKKKN